MKILITGVAGFIGMHTACKLSTKNKVFGIDNINNYYDVNLKKARLDKLNSISNFTFQKCDILNNDLLEQIFSLNNFDVVIHLAAQAGVRFSIDNPETYIDTNIKGFFNILEKCKIYKIKNFIFASSSSVYGLNDSLPFDEDHITDHPVSLYGATKKSNEIIAHSYSSLYGIPTTGLRFFTVYGPWGRPDMSPFLFAKSLLNNLPIKLFNRGLMTRDFTFIEDVVEGIEKLIFCPAKPSIKFNNKKPSSSISEAPYTLLNIGNNNPIKILDFIKILEKNFNKKAILQMLPMQQGDMKSTASDSQKLEELIKFKPQTSLSTGIKKFSEWYIKYYNY